jgi:hypothetical protein
MAEKESAENRRAGSLGSWAEGQTKKTEETKQRHMGIKAHESKPMPG